MVLGLVALDLIVFGWRINTLSRPGDVYRSTPVTAMLTTVEEPPFRILAMPGVMPANTYAWYGLSSPSGYQSLFFGRYRQVIEAQSPEPMPLIVQAAPSIGVSEMLNVRYLLSATPLDDPRLEEIQGEPTWVYRDAGAKGLV